MVLTKKDSPGRYRSGQPHLKPLLTLDVIKIEWGAVAVGRAGAPLHRPYLQVVRVEVDLINRSDGGHLKAVGSLNRLSDEIEVDGQVNDLDRQVGESFPYVLKLLSGASLAVYFLHLNANPPECCNLMTR